MARLKPYFPKSHGKPRVDDRRVLSGIIFINRNGLRWRDASEEYGPHKTLYNRWKRWSDKGIRACIPNRKQRKKPVNYDKRRYKRRNQIEIMFRRLKKWRRVVASALILRNGLAFSIRSSSNSRNLLLDFF